MSPGFYVFSACVMLLLLSMVAFGYPEPELLAGTMIGYLAVGFQFGWWAGKNYQLKQTDNRTNDPG